NTGIEACLRFGASALQPFLKFNFEHFRCPLIFVNLLIAIIVDDGRGSTATLRYRLPILLIFLADCLACGAKGLTNLT
ncbi:hypothetical protein EC5411_24986, partial [Escherichia coli 541-1]